MEDRYMEHNALERIHEGSLEPHDLPLSLIENITDKFSDERIIGEGGFAMVYKVLRRWRHRWQKSGKETPFGYQQIAKLLEIGIHCQEMEPYKRPSISEITLDVNELGNMEMQLSNANESAVGQIGPYEEDDMLGIDPLELYFPFELNKRIPCTLELTNETNDCIAFGIQTTSLLPYVTQPSKGIVQPQSKRSVNITLQPLDNAPHDKKYTNGFIVRSTKVNGSLTNEDVNEGIFNRVQGKLVDEVTLTVAYGDEVPKVTLPLEPLTISGTGNLIGPEESNVQTGEAESTTIICTFDDLIQIEPPQLCFPLLSNKRVPMFNTFKIVNVTDHCVGFNTWVRLNNRALYDVDPIRGILPPRSTQVIKVTTVAKEKEPEEMQPIDEVGVWNGILAEGVNVSDLRGMWHDKESKVLPIVISKPGESSSTVDHALVVFRDGDDGDQGVHPATGIPYDVIGEAMGAQDQLAPRRSARVNQRDLEEEEFESEEEDLIEEDEIEFEDDDEY